MPDPARRWRFLIVDNVQSNLGDAAIAVAMARSLRGAFGERTEVQVCFCGVSADPGPFAGHYPELRFVPTLWHAQCDAAFPHRFLGALVRRTVGFRFPLQALASRRGAPLGFLLPGERRLFDAYRAADAILVSGGGFLSSSWTSPAHRRWRLGEYWTALLLEKPLVFYAQSMGPFAADDPLPRRLRQPMERAALVLCRDAESVRTVRETIGAAAANVHETLDEAILLEPLAPPTPRLPPRRRRRRIGICPHQWPWEGAVDARARQDAFEERLRRVCQALAEDEDAEIVLVTTHQGIPGTLHSDTAVVERLYGGLPAAVRSQVHLVEDFLPPAQFSHLMGECDAVVSSRLHGAILSLAGGAPTVALGYEPKTAGFYRRVGLDDWALSMWHTEADQILGALRGLLAAPEAARARTAQAVARGRAIARCNIRLLKEALEGFEWK